MNYLDIDLVTGKRLRKTAINVTLGPADSDKLIRTDNAGLIDPSLLGGLQYIVSKSPTARYSTVQDAVTAAELAGVNAQILVFPGDYSPDGPITVINNCISIRGLTGNSDCTILPNITYNPIGGSNNYALSGVQINGQLRMTGSGQGVLWVDTLTVESSVGVIPILLDNTNAGSSFVSRNHIRATMLDDSGPALESDAVSVDIYNTELRRNGSSGSNNMTVNMMGSGSLFAKTTYLKGQLRAQGSGLITFNSGAIEMSGNAACFDFTGFSSAIVQSGNTQVTTGGNVIFPTNSPGQFFYTSMSVAFTATFDTSWGTQQGNNSVPVINSGSGEQVLSDDGSYTNLINPYQGLQTGITSGGEVTINADPTLVDVAAGTGVIVDWTTPTAPVITQVSWGAQAGLAIPNLAAIFTDIYVDNTGTINLASGVTPSPVDFRSDIYLQAAVHASGVQVDSISASSIPAYDVSQALLDYVRVLGPVNEGNNFDSAANANLEIAKSVGSTTLPFINRSIDTQSPTTRTNSATNPTTMNRSYKDVSYILDTGYTAIDPENYNPGAAGLSAMPNNNFQIQRFYFFGQSGVTDEAIVYGQAAYSKLEDAESSIFSESPDIDPLLTANGVFTTALIIKKGVTDLDAAILAGDAKFVQITQGQTSSAATAGTVIYRKTYVCERNSSATDKLSYGNGSNTSGMGAVVHEAGTIASLGISSNTSATAALYDITVNNVVQASGLQHDGLTTVIPVSVPVVPGDYINIVSTFEGGQGNHTASFEVEHPININAFIGATGPQGATGADGVVQFRFGTGIPAGGLGSDGDAYFDIVTGDYYRKSGGVWSLEFNSVGPTGATGADGADGVNGTNGTDGVVQFRFGTGIPAGGLGNDGDVYFDTANGDYYLKTAGVWNFQFNSVGPAGTNIVKAGSYGTTIATNVTAAVPTYIPFDDIEYEDSPVTKEVDNVTFTVNETGTYEIRFEVTITGTTNNYRYTSSNTIVKDEGLGSEAVLREMINGYIRATGGATNTTVFCSWSGDLVVGETIKFGVARVSSTVGNGTVVPNASQALIKRLK